MLLVSFRVNETESSFCNRNFMFAGSQLKGMLKEADRNSMAFPRSIDSKGKLVTTNMYD